MNWRVQQNNGDTEDRPSAKVYVVDEHGVAVAMVYKTPKVDPVARALVLAAAPELLWCLKNFVHTAEDWLPPREKQIADIKTLIETSRKIIAKAEGNGNG